MTAEKYECNKCDFQANPMSSFNIHFKNKHDINLITKCDQCEKQNTGYGGLKSLQKSWDILFPKEFKIKSVVQKLQQFCHIGWWSCTGSQFVTYIWPNS